MLALLILVLLILPVILAHVFLEQVVLLLLDLIQLGLKRLLRLLKFLLLLLELLLGFICLLALLDRALDEHVDVLQDGVFRGHRLNALVLLLCDQVLLVNLFLKLSNLRLQFLVLALRLNEFHFGLAGLTLDDAVRGVNAGVILVVVHDQCATIETLMFQLIVITVLEEVLAALFYT